MPIVVPTGGTPTLADFMARVRQDLFDAGKRAGETQRWTDADLARALDRANDTYSGAAPLLLETLISTAAYTRLYATPGPQAGTPVWYVDRVEYPYGLWPKYFQPFAERLSPLLPAPVLGSGSAAPTVAFAASGALSAGAYSWGVSYLCPGGGETTVTTLVSGTAGSGQRATLGNIPTGPYGVSDRNIYRTAAGGSSFFLVGNVGDNSATTYVDSTVSDGVLITNAAAPATNTTAGIAQFEIALSDSILPQDGTGYIGVRYAAKHELDANGTTIPERHWDLVTLGGAMYAVMAYLVPTADNFEYVDGQFRDRVDDTKAPIAWLAIGRELHTRFQARLEQVKLEGEAGITQVAQWGDKPYRWDRL